MPELRLKRIATEATFNQYKDDLRKLIEVYIKKAEREDNVEDILEDIEFELYNPAYISSIIFKNNKAYGFLLARITYGRKNLVCIIEHFFARSYMEPVYSILEDYLRKHYVGEVWFMTYRNEDAFEKLMHKYEIGKGFKKVAILFKKILEGE